MPQLTLPPGPAELFERVRAPLARAFAGGDIRFGGGTALAARWAHRHSVDVDLFTDAASYLGFQRTTGARFTLDLKSSTAVDRLAIGRDNTYISFRGLAGHVTVIPGSVTPEPRSADTVRGTDIPFETTVEILGKKLVFRMARQQAVVGQDLYDIAWASQHAATDLDRAFQVVHPGELTDILHALHDHAVHGRRLAPLLRPADPELERDAFETVCQLVRDRAGPRGSGGLPARDSHTWP